MEWLVNAMINHPRTVYVAILVISLPFIAVAYMARDVSVPLRISGYAGGLGIFATSAFNLKNPRA